MGLLVIGVNWRSSLEGDDGGDVDTLDSTNASTVCIGSTYGWLDTEAGDNATVYLFWMFNAVCYCELESIGDEDFAVY